MFGLGGAASSAGAGIMPHSGWLTALNARTNVALSFADAEVLSQSTSAGIACSSTTPPHSERSSSSCTRGAGFGCCRCERVPSTTAPPAPWAATTRGVACVQSRARPHARTGRQFNVRMVDCYATRTGEEGGFVRSLAAVFALAFALPLTGDRRCASRTASPISRFRSCCFHDVTQSGIAAAEDAYAHRCRTQSAALAINVRAAMVDHSFRGSKG